jgi:hypothetical protein
MSAFYTMLAECCLGWGHLFLRLSEWLIDRAMRAEIGDL